mmetsp:Transcript_13602/g.29963  ORF Transcript_13602/g.29963 Transcript_13602/m.29963 type:complete len:212 (-) Transcript_13602:16-651(-)
MTCWSATSLKNRRFASCLRRLPCLHGGPCQVFLATAVVTLVRAGCRGLASEPASTHRLEEALACQDQGPRRAAAESESTHGLKPCGPAEAAESRSDLVPRRASAQPRRPQSLGEVLETAAAAWKCRPTLDGREEVQTAVAAGVGSSWCSAFAAFGCPEATAPAPELARAHAAEATAPRMGSRAVQRTSSQGQASRSNWALNGRILPCLARN